MDSRPHLSICAKQNSMISIGITSLHATQPLSVVFACKTASFGAELQVSIGRRPHLSFCACITAWLASESLVSMGPIPHLWFSHSKLRIYAPEILVSMGSRPFLSFCVYKTATLGPDLPSLYGSQTSFATLSTHNSLFSTTTKRLYWFQTFTSGFVHAKQRLSV